MKAPPKPRVVVVGAYNADLTIGCATPLISGRNVIGGPMRIFGGGRGANCAVAAARFGCEVSFVGAHGRDGFGGMAQGQLSSESINLEYFFELPHIKTGTTLSLVENMTGKHYMLSAESANDHLTPAMVQSARERILQADLVISELEISSDAVWETMELCQQNQVPFILDISPLERIEQLPDNQVLLLVSDSIEERWLSRRPLRFRTQLGNSIAPAVKTWWWSMTCAKSPIQIEKELREPPCRSNKCWIAAGPLNAWKPG